MQTPQNVRSLAPPESAREVRCLAGVPQIVAAVKAGVSEPLVRLYEANPSAVKNPNKRAALDHVYLSFARDAGVDWRP